MASKLQPDDFQVGWICAVQEEYVVACELLDESYPALPVSSTHDSNTYTLGRMSQHNVVIACLPKGKYGLTSAASVAKDMLRSFPLIRFGLMVGIAGGAPTKKHDIRLGDVVVSLPVGKTGGVIHYEFGKAIQNQKLERTGALNAPPVVVLTALNAISALHERKGHQIAETVQGMVDQNSRLRKKYGRPEVEMDRLYKSTFVHPDHEQPCEKVCKKEEAQLVQRDERPTEGDDPVIHYGLIASADRLMKDAHIRDTLAHDEDVLCFEMEAAGLMDHFPCVVIRGICDYSDTHKNDIWHGYAAATAAAYAKELLLVYQAVSAQQANRTLAVEQSVNGENLQDLPHTPRLFHVNYPRNVNFHGRASILRRLGDLLTGPPNDHRRAGLYGLGGMGKTQIAVEWAYQSRASHTVLWAQGNSRAHLENSYLEIGQKARIIPESGQRDKMLSTVRDWLDSEKSGSWQLIIDNVHDADDGLEDINPLIPHHKGSVLFIGRVRRDIEGLAGSCRDLQVSPMSPSEAADLFSSLSGSKDSSSELMTRLDCIPLAITQAAAYIKTNHYSVQKYAKRLSQLGRRSRDLDSNNLLARTVQEPHNRVPQAVMTTWQCSYDRVLRESPSAAKLLQLLSLFSPTGIPGQLLESTLLANICSEGGPLDLDAEIGLLSTFALLTVLRKEDSPDDRTIQLAGLVSMWVRTQVIVDKSLFANSATQILAEVFPLATMATRMVGSGLVPHIRAVERYSHSVDAGVNISSLELNCKFGRHLYFTGAFTEARDLLLFALEGFRNLGGRRDASRLAECLHFIALSMDALDLPGALKWIDDAYSIMTEDLGKTDVRTLEILTDKAMMLTRQGKCADAEAILSDVLRERRSRLPKEDDLSCVFIHKALAEVYQLQHENRKALACYSHALALAEPVYPVHNTLMLGLMFGEIEILQRLKMQSQANEKLLDFTRKFTAGTEADFETTDITEPMSSRLAAAFSNSTLQNLLSQNPRDEIDFMDYIGMTKMEEYSPHGAVEWYEKAFEESMQKFGRDHSLTMHVRHHLANALYACGRYAEALGHMEQVIARMRLVNTDVKELLQAEQDKANIHKGKGDMRKAQKLYDDIYQQREKLLGASDVATLTSLVDLANARNIMGEYDGAIEYFRRALQGFTSLDESEHNETILDIRESLAEALIDNGQPQEANVILEQLSASWEQHQIRQLGIDVLTARAHLVANKATTALAKCQQTIEVLENWEPKAEANFMIWPAIETKGDCLQKECRHDEALREFQKVLELGEELLGDQQHPDVLKIVLKVAKANQSLAEQARGPRQRELYILALNAYWRAYNGFKVRFDENNGFTKDAEQHWHKTLTTLADLQGNTSAHAFGPTRQWSVTSTVLRAFR